MVGIDTYVGIGEETEYGVSRNERSPGKTGDKFQLNAGRKTSPLHKFTKHSRPQMHDTGCGREMLAVHPAEHS